MNSNSIGVGARLKYARIAKGLMQAEVADKIGMQRSSYSKVESGIYDLLPKYCVKLADLLELSCDYILRGHEAGEKRRRPSNENRFTKNLRPCLVRHPGMEEKRAHFHCWGRFEKPVCPSPMIGGEPGGQFSSPAAVVEYENGQVDVVFAEHIRFTDRTEDTDE